jgi:hypothetical protein
MPVYTAARGRFLVEHPKEIDRARASHNSSKTGVGEFWRAAVYSAIVIRQKLPVEKMAYEGCFIITPKNSTESATTVATDTILVGG